MHTVAAAAPSSGVMTEVIRVRELTFSYPKSAEPAVRGMDFAVGRGEIFGFLGPSGAGKSTTQKVLVGLLRGHGGDALVWGKEPLAWGSDYYQRIGVSFELPNHYQKLSGLENLRFFASLYDVDTLDPMELLDAVGLAGDAHMRVGKYSKGMQMRLTFARSLINDPELLFLGAHLRSGSGERSQGQEHDPESEGLRPHDLSHDSRHGDRRRALRPGCVRR